MPVEVWEWFWSLLIMVVVLGVFGVWRYIAGVLIGMRKARVALQLQAARRVIEQRDARIARLEREVAALRARDPLTIEGRPGAVPDWGTPQ